MSNTDKYLEQALKNPRNRAFSPKYPGFRSTKCVACGERFLCGAMGSYPRHCALCLDGYKQKQRTAQLVVMMAKHAGVIGPIDGLACVDCGNPATIWEHRSYETPLEVEPCCRSCNVKRGHARAKSIRHSEWTPPSNCEAPDCAAVTLLAAA